MLLHNSACIHVCPDQLLSVSHSLSIGWESTSLMLQWIVSAHAWSKTCVFMYNIIIYKSKNHFELQ